jgi:hypothetical protein
MSWIRAIATELWGLFVDDGLLAVLALVWILVAGLVLHGSLPSILPRAFLALLFALGFLGVVALSVLRAPFRTRARRIANPASG